MADTKHCCGPCDRDLPEDAFPIYKAGARRPQCRECFNHHRSDTALLGRIAQGGEKLASFGDPIERSCADALVRHGSVADAAASLLLEPRQLRAHLSELVRRAARRGFAPGEDMHAATPEGFSVRGVSTYYKIAEDGSRVPSGQWVKTKSDEEHRVAALLDAMSGIADAWRGKADPALLPAAARDEDLMCVYVMGDPHLGMYAWSQETGNSFDLGIAEANLCAAVDHLVDLAPPAKRGLIIDLGDFFHADNSQNQTSRSHNSLDVDTRWGKVLGVGIRAMRRCIDRSLEKHEQVDAIIEIGNHDDHSAVMLALCLQQYYEREPRVHIDTSPAKFHWQRFGKCLIGVTHGDTLKLADLPGVMACDRAQDWGETLHRYWYTGHVHHDQVKEFPGVIVETFRTLAPGDAWHRSKGYRSGQDMKMDVLHREHGRVNRHIVGINQLFDYQLLAQAAPGAERTRN